MSTGPEKGEWLEVTCDGNRRYELDVLKNAGMTLSTPDLNYDQMYAAYKAGGEATKRIIEVARDQMIGLIAVWTWSTSNWDRPKHHADAVFKVTTEFLMDLRDNWIDRSENADVRLVHMGRREQLLRDAPDMMTLFDEICAYTRERRGMVVALMMDYSGPDEEARARALHLEAEGRGTFEDCLDLPLAGVPYHEVDLRIRTGETTRIKHTNGVMSGYSRMKTRDIFRDQMLPEYTPALVLEDIEEFRVTEQRNGK